MLEIYHSGVDIEVHPTQEAIVMNRIEDKTQGIPAWLPPRLEKGWPALCVDIRADLYREKALSLSVFTPTQNGPDIPVGIQMAWKCMDMTTWSDMRGCGIMQTLALHNSGLFATKLLPRTMAILEIGPARDFVVKNLTDKAFGWSMYTEGDLTIYLTAFLDDSNRIRVVMQRGMAGITLADVYTNRYPFLEKMVFLAVDWQLRDPHMSYAEAPRADIYTGALPPAEAKMFLLERYLHSSEEYSLIIGYRCVGACDQWE